MREEIRNTHIADKLIHLLDDLEQPTFKHEHIIEISKLAKRRDLLGKRMNEQKLSCPKCGTRQIQLVGYIDIVPVQWKCRHCKHKFENEMK